MSQVKNTLKYVGFALAGGAIGATVALLTAPASGQETRRKLSRRIDEEKDALLRSGRKAVTEVSEYVSDQVQEGKRRLARAVNA